MSSVKVEGPKVRELQIAQEDKILIRDPAALPGRGQDPSGGGLDAFMRIAVRTFHVAESAADEVTQEFGPEGFGGADRHAQHFAPTVGVDTHCERDRYGYDPLAWRILR